MKDKTFEKINHDVYNECKREDYKWGENRHHSPYTWLAILTEEVGESAQAALQDEYGGSHAGTLRDELIQVASVCFQWINDIDGYGTNATKMPSM